MKKGDKLVAIFIAVIILISGIGVYAYMSFSKGNSRIAEIKQDGKLIKTIDLNKVTEPIEIRIPYGDNYNIVYAEKGRIRVTDADCPDKLCVESGWISEPGKNVICLPHRLIISIQGTSKDTDQNVY